MEYSENLDRLALLELRKIINLELNDASKKDIFLSIHNLLPILNYLGENESYEKVLEIKGIKNLKMQKMMFLEASEFIRANIRNDPL